MTVKRRPSKSSSLPTTSAAAEAALPQAPADHDDVLLAGGLLVSGEEAALHGLHAEHVEQRRFGKRAADPLGLAVADQVQGRLGERRHGLERRAEALVVLIVEVGRPILAHLQAAVVHPHARKPLRLAIRQGLQQDVANDAEQRDIRADTQRQRDDGGERESGVDAELAETVAKVSDQAVCLHNRASGFPHNPLDSPGSENVVKFPLSDTSRLSPASRR